MGSYDLTIAQLTCQTLSLSTVLIKTQVKKYS